MQKLFKVFHPDGWEFTGTRMEALAQAEHYCKLYSKSLDDIKIKPVVIND